jgi:hypothetical protein
MQNKFWEYQNFKYGKDLCLILHIEKEWNVDTCRASTYNLCLFKLTCKEGGSILCCAGEGVTLPELFLEN